MGLSPSAKRHLVEKDRVEVEVLNELLGPAIELLSGFMGAFPEYLEQHRLAVAAGDWEAVKALTPALTLLAGQAKAIREQVLGSAVQRSVSEAVVKQVSVSVNMSLDEFVERGGSGEF